MGNCLKKRKLEFRQIVLEQTDSDAAEIRLNSSIPHRYDQLDSAERKKVSMISDSKSINRTSDASYAAMRRIISELPPLTHVKEYNHSVIAGMPALLDAPGRPGAFFSLRHEVKSQLEYLAQSNGLNSEETIYVKAGVDATRLDASKSVCIYSIETISSDSEIGLVGAVLGGDQYEDMALCGKPFFDQLKELAQNPNITTKYGNFAIEIRLGGDLCNLLEQLH